MLDKPADRLLRTKNHLTGSNRKRISMEFQVAIINLFIRLIVPVVGVVDVLGDPRG